MVDPRHPSVKRRRMSKNTPIVSSSMGRSSRRGGLNQSVASNNNSPKPPTFKQRRMLPNSRAANSIDASAKPVGLSIDLNPQS